MRHFQRRYLTNLRAAQLIQERRSSTVTPARLGDLSATRVIASTLGVFAGMSGLDHGFFEVLQGNVATPGTVVQSIGPGQRMWVYGTEEAITLVPNFLVTGILAMTVAVLLIVWSVGFIDRKRGSTVFALLGALLFLVGGGAAMVMIVMIGWVVSTRIGSPSKRLGRLAISRALAKRWPALLVAMVVLYLIALEIAIVGFVPGVSDPDQARYICWSSLAMMLVLLVLAIAGGRASDIDRAGTSKQ